MHKPHWIVVIEVAVDILLAAAIVVFAFVVSGVW